MKELQARYANNPEAANQAVQQLYQTENVNPLAGCLPAIAQIPIFISLYRCGSAAAAAAGAAVDIFVVCCCWTGVVCVDGMRRSWPPSA